jgi:hypothetical protein
MPIRKMFKKRNFTLAVARYVHQNTTCLRNGNGRWFLKPSRL